MGQHSAASEQKLLILLGKSAPELEVLSRLPSQATIVATGNTPEDLAGLSKEQLASVTGVLVTGGRPGVQRLKDNFAALTSLRWVHSASAGLDKLLFPALVDSDVTITNAKGTFSSSLAEYAITGCLYFAKNIPRLVASKEASKWDPFEVEELRGKTMGIIGYGDIGQACARLARGYQMQVGALRRRTELSGSEQKDGLQVRPPDQLNELMAESDYVVMALPGTPATKHFVSSSALAAMKPTGVLINLGRGATLDEAAVVTALQERKIKGVVLDVFEQEPLPELSPLWQLDNALLSPHCADLTKEMMHEALEQFVENVQRSVEGRELINVTDKHHGY